MRVCVVEGEDVHTVWGLALGMVLVKGAGNDPHGARISVGCGWQRRLLSVAHESQSPATKRGQWMRGA